MSWTTLLVGIVVVATFAIGSYGVRLARTTSDFFVATRAVGPIWNASAIAGEYLSAASFLGIAGLVMKEGASVLWYPLGYAAGYLVLLLFVAAPLRRFGAYTIPDFAEGRFHSRRMRTLAATMVLVIAWFYLLPQMKGAGVTLQLLTGAPYWAGVVLVGFLVTVSVTLGGMKGVTYVQAFHYWVKLIAIGAAAGVLLAVVGLTTSDGATPFDEGPARFHRPTSVEFPASVVLGPVDDLEVVVDGRPAVLEGTVVLPAGSEVSFPAGAPVPTARLAAPDGRAWTLPFIAHDLASLVSALSLLIATVLGTMGLPHILVRFYTNRDGRSARRTAVATLGLVGIFYFSPWVLAAIGRVWSPELYLTGDTEVVVLVVPHLVAGTWGRVLSGLVAAGAFSAFLSTSSGLLVAVAGALSHDLAGPIVRRSPDSHQRTLFRLAAVVGGLVAVGLGMFVRPFEINVLVGWAFAIAASAFAPLLILGIWWPGLGRRAAAAGMTVGGGSATVAILVTMLFRPAGWLGILLEQPAILTVALSFGLMVGLSRRERPPAVAGEQLLLMHSPDRPIGRIPAFGRRIADGRG